MTDILNQTLFGNSYFAYIIALSTFLFGLILIFLFKNILVARLKKWSDQTETTIDDLLVNEVERTLMPIMFFGVLFISIKTLHLSNDFVYFYGIATKVLFTFLFVRVVLSILNHLTRTYLRRYDDFEQRQKQLKGIKVLVNILIWVIAGVFLLDNLGVEISAVVAGLGIGGIAVALAAQVILGDLFSYFVIFFDRPFTIGDFIIVDDKLGVIEYVGIKTTRIRALSGEQLIFSNTDLTNSRVHNYKKMERRRVVFKLGVVYQTSYEKLKLIPTLVREIIEKQEGASFDRGHFASYGDFSLNFEFVYYIEGSDYNKYMDIQQNINFEIFKSFENDKIEFAYPTQTIYVSKENSEAA
ncbi:MAG: mechanosensitive ion channel family protein [Ignavibacteriaceae bacterium]